MKRRSVDETLAVSLIAKQCPQWADEIIRAIPSTGTDHKLFRLGDDRLIRLPVADWAAEQAITEHRYLPMLGNLPLEIPQPLHLGLPSVHFNAGWSVVQWIEGQFAEDEAIDDWEEAATALASFLKALWIKDISSSKSLPTGLQRGGELEGRNQSFCQSLRHLEGIAPTLQLAELWSEVLDAEWNGLPRCWIHGDLHAGNLIARNSKLVGVIDWGMMGVGDPAVDLMAAWTWLPRSARPAFKDMVGGDDALWLRARGWALSVAVIALAHYRGRHEAMERMSNATLKAVIEDI